MSTQLEPNPHAMKSGDPISTSEPRPPRGPRSADLLLRTELKALLEEYKEIRGMLSISLNMYPLRTPVLRSWQDKLDAANARLEQLLQG